MSDGRGFCTRALHADGEDRPFRAHAVPIFQSSSFGFDDARQGAEMFEGREEGYIYTRWSNPTTEALERVMASLEGGESAAAFSSGMAAITAVLLGHLKAGDHAVIYRAMYGPSVSLGRDILPRYGIETTVIDPTEPGALEAAMRPATRLFIFETPGNPTLAVVDIAEAARLAHARGALVVVDNTFATPYLQRPLSLGADLVVHSATKYLNGHADVIAGVVVGPEELVAPVREFRKNTGACLSPFDSFLLLRGIRTLGLRMERHSSNAAALALLLDSHPAVERVYYPGLPSHPGHETASRQMKAWGGMISFEMKGGYDAAVRLLDGLELISLVISLGTVDTIISHPASMTHRGLPRELREAQGITDGLVRISVGIEDVEDLAEDLRRALDAV